MTSMTETALSVALTSLLRAGSGDSDNGTVILAKPPAQPRPASHIFHLTTFTRFASFSTSSSVSAQGRQRVRERFFVLNGGASLSFDFCSVFKTLFHQSLNIVLVWVRWPSWNVIPFIIFICFFFSVKSGETLNSLRFRRKNIFEVKFPTLWPPVINFNFLQVFSW